MTTGAGNANNDCVDGILSVDSDLALKLAHTPLITKVDYTTRRCSLIFRDRVFDAPEHKRETKEGALLDAMYGKTADDAILCGGFAGSEFMKVFGVGESFARTMRRHEAARDEWVLDAVKQNAVAVKQAQERLARRHRRVGSGPGAQAPASRRPPRRRRP